MAAGFRSQIARANGHEVPVQVGGSGPALLYLHGAGGAGLIGEFERALAESFTVYAPLHPGFGGTPLPDWVKATDDVALHYLDLIQALGIGAPIVVGHSLGGWIATELAVFRPASLERLVLVSAIGVRPEKPMPDLFIMDPPEMLGLLFADPAKAVALLPAQPDTDFVVRRYEEQAAVARLAWKRPYNSQLRRRLHHITCPTLVVWGDSDRLIPASHGEKILAKEIPGARFRLIERAGHVVPIEAPRALADAIRAFAAPRR